MNYRCPPAVVDAARHLLSYNRARVDKTHPVRRRAATDAGHLRGPLAGAGPVAVRPGPATTLAALAVEIITAWRAAGVDPADIAVLARVNSALLPVQVACMESGIPCTTPLAASVLARTGIRTAFAYLRIGADPGHIRQGGRPRHHPAAVPGHRPHGGGHDHQAVDHLDRRHPAPGRPTVRPGRPQAPGLRRRPRGRGRGGRRSSAAALEAIRVGIGLDGTMDVLDSSRNEADRSTHADDLAALEAVAALHPEAATFEHWLREVLTRPPAEGPGAAVHRAPDQGQGVGPCDRLRCVRGLFPHRLGDDEEGERRVFHVALTRAGTQVVGPGRRRGPVDLPRRTRWAPRSGIHAASHQRAQC